MLTDIDCLFFLNCLLVVALGLSWAASGTISLIAERVGRVATLLVEVRASTIIRLLLDNEIGWTIQIGIRCLGWVQRGSRVIHALAVLQSVRVLTDVGKQLLAFVVLLCPLSHVV